MNSIIWIIYKYIDKNQGTNFIIICKLFNIFYLDFYVYSKKNLLPIDV